MLEKTLFKASPVSYSRFLQSKEFHVHCLTDARESVDIAFFRRSISFHYQHAYAKKKWQNWVYRFIFFGFGLLFLVLGAMIFFKTVNFACGFYIKNCTLVKNGINLLCLLLAGGAFAIGYKIHPEKDAIQYLMGKVERELTHPAKHLQIEFNAIISNLTPESIAPHQTIWIKKTLNPIS
jgi:hypothetical protein